jgi:hypothetical protein
MRAASIRKSEAVEEALLGIEGNDVKGSPEQALSRPHNA